VIVPIIFVRRIQTAANAVAVLFGLCALAAGAAVIVASVT
jgi:hypothetical protein